MEDIDIYFRKWRECRNANLDNKSSTSIKGVEKDEAKDIQLINQTNQQLNKST